MPCITRNYAAAHAMIEISQLAAFSLPQAKRRKVNGSTSIYEFPDGSCLKIRTGRRLADCWHPAWKGTADDIHLGPIAGYPIHVNRQGA